MDSRKSSDVRLFGAFRQEALRISNCVIDWAGTCGVLLASGSSGSSGHKGNREFNWIKSILETLGKRIFGEPIHRSRISDTVMLAEKKGKAN